MILVNSRFSVLKFLVIHTSGSSSRCCGYSSIFRLVRSTPRFGCPPVGGFELRRGEASGALPAGGTAAPPRPGALSIPAPGAGQHHFRRDYMTLLSGGRHERPVHAAAGTPSEGTETAQLPQGNTGRWRPSAPPREWTTQPICCGWANWNSSTATNEW